MSMTQFYKDLEEAHKGENLVLEVLNKVNTNPWIEIENVADNKNDFYKGDLRVMDYDTFDEAFIEVKTDNTISSTHNILCEDHVYYADKKLLAKGNMYCESDYYFILSKAERIIYCLDFKILQKIYKMGKYKIIDHYDEDGKIGQTTHCFLVSLKIAEQQGALLGKLKY